MKLIFVIDDDVASGVALSQELRQEGYAVITAETLAEAESTLAVLHPDVVVIDEEPSQALMQQHLAGAALLVYSRAEALAVRHLNPVQMFRNPYERDRLLETIRQLCAQSD